MSAGLPSCRTISYTRARSARDEAELAWLPATDPAATVRADVNTLVTAPQISPNIRISGYVYNTAVGTVDTAVGTVDTVVVPTPPASPDHSGCRPAPAHAAATPGRTRHGLPAAAARARRGTSMA